MVNFKYFESARQKEVQSQYYRIKTYAPNFWNKLYSVHSKQMLTTELPLYSVKLIWEYTNLYLLVLV